MADETEWQHGRDQFVEHDTAARQCAEPMAASLPADIGPLAGQFVDLAESLFDADTVGAVLHHVVHATRQVTPGCDLASITMRLPNGQGFSTPVFTDPLAERIDQAQYAADEGPCLEATRTDGLGIALCADLARDTRQWPRFSPAAAELGMGSLLGVGLFPRAKPPRMGALNLYSARPHGLDAADRDIALLMAAHASVALARTEEVQAARLEVTQLTEALQSRDVIGQAKGILMERRGVDAGEAFDILRRASQDLNVKLTEIARTLASRRADL